MKNQNYQIAYPSSVFGSAAWVPYAPLRPSFVSGGFTQRAATRCPCCGADVDSPSLDMIVDACQLPRQQAAILRTAWKANGHPVPTSRFVEAIYADDPDGGPGESTARRYFKTQLCLLRARLATTSVSIETLGRGLGYRLKLDRAQHGEHDPEPPTE
jgi:hypothetical protein